MLSQKQLIKHEPEKKQFGDCYRTCIASLLDMKAETVPHFMHDGDGEQAAIRSREWLNKRGYRMVTIPYTGDCEPGLIMQTMAAQNPGLYYLFTGRSGIACAHTVVCRDDDIVCDPSGNGIVGDYDGFFWVEFLVPLLHFDWEIIYG